MVARINTVAFHGVEVQGVDVQVQISNGLPAFTNVGYNIACLKKMAKIWGLSLFLIFLPSVFLPKSQGAHAFSCTQEEFSIKNAFDQSEVVFKGEISALNPDGSVSTKIIEAYKHTQPLPNNGTFDLYFIGRGINKLEPVQFIVYGSYKEGNGAKINTGPCRQQPFRLTAQNYMNYIQEAAGKLDEEVALSEVVFIGEVLRQDYIPRKNGKDKSVIFIRPVQILYANTDRSRKYLQNAEIELQSWCGDEMHVGEKYILSAKISLVRAENGERLKEPRTILWGSCTPSSPVPLKEEFILRSLSKDRIQNGSPH